MRIGVPKEIKNHEYRVGLTPASVKELVAAGHELFVETNAGSGIDCPDSAYEKNGAKILGIPALPFIALIVLVVGGIVLHKTKFGRYTYAVGSNDEAARRAGVRVDRHLIRVYTLAGFCAGLAGILNLAFFASTTIAGQSNTALNVIAGVVIGGTSLFGGIGTIAGTVVGLFIPAVLQNGFVIMGVQPFWQQVVVGAFLIAAVYVDQVRRAAAARGASTRRPLSSRFSRPAGARRKEAQ